MDVTERTIFVDESIHDGLGFVVTALVVAHSDVEDRVASALRENGFLPEVDEFKSGAQMGLDPLKRRLRKAILNVAATETKIAVLISPAADRKALGSEILQALALVVRRNGLGQGGLCVVLDQGFFRSRAHADAEIARAMLPVPTAIEPEQDSKRRLGLQVADAVAHTVAQILRQGIVAQRKTVTIRSELGYADGTEVELGWALLMNLRHAFFTRPMVYTHLGDKVDPEQNPVVITPDDDPTTYGQHPHMLGWGVFIADSLPSEVRAAAESIFEKIWLGCIH